MKGISPLIAAVMLIAFTIAVGTIFAQWSSGMFTDQQDDTSQNADRLQKCSQISLNFAETPTNQSALVQQKGGEIPIGNLTATWRYQDGSMAQEDGSIDSVGGVTMIETTESGNLTILRIDPQNCPGAPSLTYS